MPLSNKELEIYRSKLIDILKRFNDALSESPSASAQLPADRYHACSHANLKDLYQKVLQRYHPVDLAHAIRFMYHKDSPFEYSIGGSEGEIEKFGILIRALDRLSTEIIHKERMSSEGFDLDSANATV